MATVFYEQWSVWSEADVDAHALALMLAPGSCDPTLPGRAGGPRQLVRQRRPIRCGARARARAGVRQPAPQPPVGLMWGFEEGPHGACMPGPCWALGSGGVATR